MSGVPHGEEVLADSGIETPVWVCPECNEYQTRDPNDPHDLEPPTCLTGYGIDPEPCGAVMAKGILVSRATVYNATTV